VFKKIVIIHVSVLVLAFVLFYQCSQKAKDITYTTKSPEARKLFLEGLAKDDAFYEEEAGELFKQAIEADPEFAMAYYHLALLAATTADYIDRFNKAVELSGNISEPEKLIIHGAKAIFDEEMYEARECLEKLVELLPEGKRAHYLLGNFYFNRNEWALSESEYQQSILLDPEFAPAYNMLGYALSNQDKYTQAIEALKKYAKLQPDDPNPHDSMGEIYLMISDYNNSIKSYNNALELDPDFIISIAGLGHNYSFLGKYNKAREKYELIFKHAQNEADTNTGYYWIAVSHIIEGNYQKAIDVLKKRLKYSKKTGNLYSEANTRNMIAFIYYEKSEFSKALKETAALRKLSMNPQIHNRLKEQYLRNCSYTEALVYASQNRNDLAIAKTAEYEKSVKTSNNPNLEKTLHGLKGIVYYWNNEYESAIDELSQADSQSQYPKYYYGLSYRKSGDEKRAKDIFEDIAKFNRNDFYYAFVRPKAAG